MTGWVCCIRHQTAMFLHAIASDFTHIIGQKGLHVVGMQLDGTVMHRCHKLDDVVSMSSLDPLVFDPRASHLHTPS